MSFPNPTLSKRNSVDAHGLMGYKAMTLVLQKSLGQLYTLFDESIMPFIQPICLSLKTLDFPRDSLQVLQQAKILGHIHLMGDFTLLIGKICDSLIKLLDLRDDGFSCSNVL